jgi:hypothetical protein
MLRRQVKLVKHVPHVSELNNDPPSNLHRYLVSGQKRLTELKTDLNDNYHCNNHA